MVRWQRLALVVGMVLVAATGVSHAQTTVVAPSAAQRCLTRGDVLLGAPAFPQRALQFKASGRVTVELEFTAADAAPRLLKIESKDVGRSEFAELFEKSVREFIQAYRVPCLRQDEISLLNQEFVFLPQDLRGVTMMALEDEQSAREQRLRGCMLHQRPDDKPSYPAADLRAERQGTAVVRAEFVDAESPPRVTILDDGGSGSFGARARNYALGWRLPCHDGAGSVSVVSLFEYRIDGGSRVVLTDSSLLTLLPAIKGIRSANLYFDFNTMDCPFDVHLQVMQPHAFNRVGEIGTPNPERRFFLDWLSRQQLDLPPRELNAVIGQSARVSVPCTILNLGSQSGGGASK